jgi:hypothetical protein
MGKQKNRLTATKPRNDFARIFFKVCAQTKPATAIPMVVLSPPCGACGALGGAAKRSSRVGGRTWSWRVGATYPVPTLDQVTYHGPKFPPTLDQVAYPGPIFSPTLYLPYTSPDFRRPPRLGGASQRAVSYTAVIVSPRRVEWCPPGRRGVSCWRDDPAGPSVWKFQLVIA